MTAVTRRVGDSSTSRTRAKPVQRIRAFLVARLEAVALLGGLACMTIAIGAIDWRAGLFVAGLCLALSSIDFGRRR